MVRMCFHPVHTLGCLVLLSWYPENWLEKERPGPLLVNNGLPLGADPSSVSHQDGQPPSAQRRSKCWQTRWPAPPPEWLGFCSCRKVLWLKKELRTGSLLTLRMEIRFQFLPSPCTSQTAGRCRLTSLNTAVLVPHAPRLQCCDACVIKLTHLSLALTSGLITLYLMTFAPMGWPLASRM